MPDDRSRRMPRGAVPLIRVGILLPFAEFLAEIGAPVERLLTHAGLSPAVLEVPEALVPLHGVHQFVDYSARKQGVDNLGLVVGGRMPIQALGAFGHLIAGAPTLHLALHLAEEAIRLYNSAARIWVDSEGERVAFHYHGSVEAAAAERHADALIIQLMLAIIRQAAGPGWVPTEIRLPVRERLQRKEYEECFRCPVRFESDTRTIVFGRQLLSVPLRRAGPLPAFSPVPHALLQASAPATDLPGSIGQMVEALLAGGYPGIDRAGKIMGSSVRTLQRRLQEDGTNYSRLVTRARFDLARSLLEDERIRITEIAFRLGYSDPANFTHAFKRWAGLSPSEFRRQRESSEGDAS
jgi:AraC-like DNA-binding protein